MGADATPIPSLLDSEPGHDRKRHQRTPLSQHAAFVL